MKLFRNLVSFAIIFGAIAVASTSAQYSKQPLSGAALEQKIFKEIRTLPRYGVFDHITFQVSGSQVVLDGNTYSLGTRKSAERVVRQIPGVSEVVNNIDELPMSSLDDAIRREALRSFTGAGLYRYLYETDPAVRIVVDRGRISLEGFVSSEGDSNLFNILARSIPGAFGVENNLVIGRDARRQR